MQLGIAIFFKCDILYRSPNWGVTSVGGATVFTVLLWILGAILATVALNLKFADPDDRAFTMTLACVIAVVLGTIGGGITGVAIGSGLPTKAVVREHHQLVSLHDATGIEGSFFLASGSVGSQTRIYYVEATSKGLQFHSVDEEDSSVYVIQENRSDGELDVVDYTFQNASDWNWAFPHGGEDMVFHVPEGSVTTCYQLTQGASANCPGS